MQTLLHFELVIFSATMLQLHHIGHTHAHAHTQLMLDQPSRRCFTSQHQDPAHMSLYIQLNQGKVA